ncbi:L,D-transpeptidase [Streptomyces sp. ActVer]|uniref:L,D-transpeptidase n=1 Tax=Streptomyces sp. ActVer TaxID=3014558 RepID=UPI0022B30A9E|nr:L,D-transpeptidase [Streptomyces sp. ActVer]MCZ4511163.1 L,D-transpeptidase [Streptomyces sp. ActVer]
MSDELTPGTTRGFEGLDAGPDSASGGTELATALRELAHDHETPVPVPGTEIRRRAGRRRRRRQVSFAAAGATAAGALALVLTVVLTGGRDAGSTTPAASYTAPTPPTPPATAEPSPVAVAATVDLGRREMSVEGRTLPISSGSLKTPTPTGLMTVTAKYRAATVPGDSAGWNGYDVKGTWVMRLRTPDDRTNYLLALTWDEKAPGNYDRTGGVIGLRRDDAMWLYEALKPGSVVEVVGSAPQETSGGTGMGAGAGASTDSDSGAMATTPTEPEPGALEATPAERGLATP